ncbi:MAG: GAF domain-containing protein [Bdellovibrionales bacterium]|nr:GAF domain-containing protein [Bdellovibrionales bacterium]
MKVPPPSPTEEARLRELYDYDILETPPEPEFDALTELASVICGTPIALISLVDRNRQWFKSKIGLLAPETHRDVSFCGHAILEEDVFVVENALEDPRFSDNPLVTGDPRIRFYAGAQLRTESGEAIGTLCVIDSEPKSFSKEKRKALATLAGMVIAQLDLKRRNRQLSEALELIEGQKLSLLHQSKMSALGEMAGGIAHEINNPLAIIAGYVNRIEFLIQKPLEETGKEKLKHSLDGISKSVHRISSIIKGLQLFSRDSQLDPLQPSDLITIIRDSLELCKEGLKTQNIELRVSLPTETVSSECRPSQISQILVNLVQNARDAVRNQEGQKWISLSLALKDGKPIIQVEDSGPGVPEDLQTKIFHPFFTTKEPGRGTGLGLSISSSLAESNRATLRLEPGKGSSRFILEFGRE